MKQNSKEKTNYGKLLHPDFKHYAFRLPFNNAFIRLAALALPPMFALTPMPKGILHRRFTVKGYDGLSLPIHVFEPNQSDRLPCLLYLHGGGFAYKAAPYHKKLVCEYAKGANCRVIMPDYHILPKYPFPAAYEDAIAAYGWIAQNSDMLNVDISRIAVGGDSAGGTLTANVCNTAVGRGLPAPCFQMMIYPATDADMHTESMREYATTPLWNAVNNRKMWAAYLRNATQGEIEVASPVRNQIPAFLPPTYLETAQYDCLRDEGIEYAELLEKHGVKVILNSTEGTFHGYDIVAKSGITKSNIDKRIELLSTYFNR